MLAVQAVTMSLGAGISGGLEGREAGKVKMSKVKIGPDGEAPRAI